MIIFYSDECRRNVLQRLDKTWGKRQTSCNQTFSRYKMERSDTLSEERDLYVVLTFCALDGVKTLSAR